MTTYYGSLVGSVLSASQSVPLVSNALKGGGDQVLIRDTIELAASANDLVSLGKIDWEAVINPQSSKFYFDDLGTSTTFSIGDVTYPTALCSAQDVATAAGSADVMKSVDIANYFKPLWAVLGYATLAAAKAIGPTCELLGKVGVAGATGTVSWQIMGRKL